MKDIIRPGVVITCLLLAHGAAAQTTNPGSGRQPGSADQAARRGVATPQMPQGFSVVLVVGDLQAGTVQDNVPVAARKALADMKDFLPYKGYRLLDVHWTLCCGRTPVTSRLRGPEGQEYELVLNTSHDARGRLSVRFLLTEASRATNTVNSGRNGEVLTVLMRERERVQSELASTTSKARSRFEVGTGRSPEEVPEVAELKRRLADIDIRIAEARERTGQRSEPRGKAAASQAVIDTSFTMDVGETVVVGTSRIAGADKALIALLTAVPQKSSR